MTYKYVVYHISEYIDARGPPSADGPGHRVLLQMISRSCFALGLVLGICCGSGYLML